MFDFGMNVRAGSVAIVQQLRESLMRALMVDDHAMFLQGMRTLLGVLAPELSVDTAPTTSEAVGMWREHRHDLVLLDWHLGSSDGMLAVDMLRDAGCDSRIVVVSGETDPASIADMLAVGIAGFIPKTFTGQRLLEALQVVMDGCIYIPAEFVDRIDRAPAAARRDEKSCLALLTARQADVFRAAARGLPNKLIARELQVTEATVKSHLTAVFAVLGVRNRTQAALLAARAGLRLD